MSEPPRKYWPLDLNLSGRRLRRVLAGPPVTLWRVTTTVTLWSVTVMVTLWSVAAAQATPSCLTAKCHSSLKDSASRHLLAGQCTDCHLKTDHESKVFTMVAEGRRLCLTCHKPDSPPQKHAHAGMNQAECSLCHLPHGSPNKASLRQWPVSTLCGACHPTDRRAPGAHAPYQSGDCTLCHATHGSKRKALLKADQSQLCRSCHDRPKMDDVVYGHAPVERGQCSACHSAHASPFPALLRRPGRELCLGCHTEEPNLTLPFVHAALKKRSCSGCHLPHGSQYKGLLVQSMPGLCYECHERKDTGPVVHAAVRLGECAGCHTPHASRTKELLRFGKLSDNCYTCHCDDVTRRTSTHWPVKGGVCDQCHESHEAKLPKLLKEPPLQICFKCHGDMRPPDTSYPHQAMVLAGCLACHDPHGSAATNLLKKPVNQLCAACHPQQKDGHHIFSLPGGKPHPVSGVADPVHLNRELSCVSCHTMTSGNGPGLFRHGKSKMELCAMCHEGQQGKPRSDIQQHTRPSHNAPRGMKRRPAP